ncbi:uncharacterized protein LOC106878799 isoform X2 [Octopus bimaculoides]|nr:uncharacterized protein LOC106878799 isoform X2 [Octopus bimaculoides]XP_052832932.1 uncharacterized protein LOC106878799 isoform X2 [Octopus bimaculoides]
MSDRNIQFKASMVGMWLDMEIPVVLEQISNLLQLKHFQKVKVQLSRQGLKLTKKGKLPGLSSEDLIPLQNIEDIFVDNSIPTCFICITTACSSSPTQIMALKCLNEICARGIVTHYKILTGDKKKLVQSLRNAQLASLGASQTSNNSTNSDSSEGNNDLSDGVGSNTESGYTTDHELCEKETDSDSKPEGDLVLSGLSLKDNPSRNNKQDIKILMRNVSNLRYLLQKHAATISRQEFLDANKKIQELNEEMKKKTRKSKNSESDGSKSKKGNSNGASSSSSGVSSENSNNSSSSSANSDDNSDSQMSKDSIYTQISKRKSNQTHKIIDALVSDGAVNLPRVSSNSSMESFQAISKKRQINKDLKCSIIDNEDTEGEFQAEIEFLAENDDVFYTNQLGSALRGRMNSDVTVVSIPDSTAKTRKKSNIKRDSEKVLSPGRQVRFSESTETVTMASTPTPSEQSYSDTMEIPVRRHFFYQKSSYQPDWTPTARNDVVRMSSLKTHVLKPIERVYSNTTYRTYAPSNDFRPKLNSELYYQYEPSFVDTY